KRVEFAHVSLVREGVPKPPRRWFKAQVLPKPTGLCRFTLECDDRRKIRFAVPVLQSAGVRAARSSKLGDRYCTRVERQTGLLALALGLFSIPWLVLGAVRAGAGSAVCWLLGLALLGGAGYVLLATGAPWTSGTEAATEALKRDRPERKAVLRARLPV